MKAAFDHSEAGIISRLIGQENGFLSPEAADYILNLRFAKPDIDRMNVLAQKAREGSLSPDESIEIENYRHLGSILEILQSKARRSKKALATVA